MAKRAKRPERRNETLSRERIIEAAIQLLDETGEDGLTFRALSQRLATGPGALYWHIADKSDLVTAACDAMVAQTISSAVDTTPKETIRTVALQVFDTIDDHPWIGSALTGGEGLSPLVRILEPIGNQISRLNIPLSQQWAAVNTLLAYIVGVSKQNAANRQLAQARGLNRSRFLEGMAHSWLQLDEDHYPFTRIAATKLKDHDDRADFAAGIDLILEGIVAHAKLRATRKTSRSAIARK